MKNSKLTSGMDTDSSEAIRSAGVEPYRLRADEQLKRDVVPDDLPLIETKQFLLETASLQRGLQLLVPDHLAEIRQFFRRYSFPKPEKFAPAKTYIKKLGSKNLRTLLRRYLKYSLRFQVYFTFDKADTPMFSPVSITFHGKKLSARIYKAQLVPQKGHFRTVNGKLVSKTENRARREYADYEDAEIDVPAEFTKMGSTYQFRWLNISDRQNRSLLSKIEQVAYHPNSLVFIEHDAPQPFLWCIVGENVSFKHWREAHRIVSEFLQTQYGTATAGRKPKLDRDKQELNSIVTGSDSKENTLELNKPFGDTSPFTGPERMSRARSAVNKGLKIRK